MKIILLKLGGSLITDKSKPYTERPETIARLAREIKEALEEDPEIRLVLGNGGGSFPHTSAQKHGTIDGFAADDNIDPEKRQGFAEVSRDARAINVIIGEALLKEGIPAIGMQPSALIVTDMKSASVNHVEPIEEALAKGLVPVVYGDAMIDRTMGSTIYSTDMVLSIIAKRMTGDGLKPEKMISATVVDGVMDENNETMPELDPNDEKLTSIIKGSKHTDVTGGMLGKVRELAEVARFGIETRIVCGEKEGNVKNALLGKDAGGTLIKGS